MNQSGISERAQCLFKRLVELYIRDGQPVGSKTLSQAFFSLSPATIRKVLSDLEEQGFLTSPHTSAGRIPTTQGYRFFVDSLLSIHHLEAVEEKVQATLHQDQPMDTLITETSALLSELTHMVGIVTLPQSEQLILRHVEFLSLSDNRVLVILVFNEREVQNRIIITDRTYTDSELIQASNFLNQHFSGKELFTARQELLQSLNYDRSQVDSLMKAVVDVASKAFVVKSPQKEYVLAGQQNLLKEPASSVRQLQRLFEAFTQKHQILRLLDQCLETEGVQMFIGEESGYDAFREHSVVTAQYKVEGKTVGVVGVIGPTRMQYDKVIPVVELTAKVLSTLLNSEK